MMAIKALLFLLMISFSLPVIAEPGAKMQERYNVGGYLEVSKTTPHTFQPSKYPRALSDAFLANNGNRKAKKIAKRWFKKSKHVTELLLIDHDNIVFEGYKGLGNKLSEFYGMSMAKSLTNLAVGKALCNRALKKLDLLAGELVPEIKVNNLGRSTVRQLLMMSSGHRLTKFSGQPTVAGGMGINARGKITKSPAWPIRLGQITVDDYLWGHIWKNAENKKYADPGKVFIYTAAYFDKHVWQLIQPQSKAHWTADRERSKM